jgi:hypothetical protein
MMIPLFSRPRLVASGAGFLLVLAVPLMGLEAQGSRSVLTFLPVEGRTITLGEEREGMLGEADPFSTVGSLLQAWRYEARGGETIAFDVRSTAFDAFLYLLGPSLSVPLGDDDGAGGCDARITYTFPEAGEYRLIVTEALISGGGSFTLRALQDPPPPSELPCLDLAFDDDGWPGGGAAGGATGGATFDQEILPSDLSSEGRVLALPGQGEGFLDPSVPGARGARGGVLQAWAITLDLNQTVTFDLRSGDFDAFLYVTGPGLEAPLWDDDGGEELNSRLTFTAPTSGTFLVVASSFAEEAGAYTLSVVVD